MLIDAPNPPPPQKTRTAFKNPLLYSSILVGIVLLAVLWILFSRWQENRTIERRSRDEKTRKQLENDRVALEQMGGNELTIQSFYASPGAIRRGQSVQLCYGVANAKTVKLEPQPNAVWPSYARCVTVTPVKSTTYTLTINDAVGNSQTQSLEVKVE
ncbi:MAG TPA: PKD domain-containing protein [Candidatus Acidoferrum sp.]|nr:PKD domain-containing protein [Candidatus Acidoferrum sp.]